MLIAVIFYFIRYEKQFCSKFVIQSQDQFLIQLVASGPFWSETIISNTNQSTQIFREVRKALNTQRHSFILTLRNQF